MSEKQLACIPVPTDLNPDGVQIRIAGTNDSPAMNVWDICCGLGYKDPDHQVTKLLAKYGKDKFLNFLPSREETPTLGRPRTCEDWYAPEPQAYKIFLQSGVPHAEQFVDWVCGDVLPCIRKHGCYPAPVGLVNRAEERQLRSALDDLHIEVRQLRLSLQSPNVEIPGMINARTFVMEVWPEITPRVLGSLIQLFDTKHRKELGRGAPKMTENKNSPLGCKPEHFGILLQAFQHFWRKEYRPSQRDLF